MKILKTNFKNPDEKIIDKAVTALKKGGVIIYPTDTVYGLGANALDEKVVNKIFRIKGRSFKKPISIIIKDVEQAKEVASFNKDIERILNKIWPGPVTAILYKKDIIPDILIGGSKKIGLRIPDCEFTKQLMKKIDFPITTTSANISGLSSSEDIKQVLSQFQDKKIKPDLILDVGILPQNLPSTVIDFTEAEPKILRAGPITKDKLFKILNFS